MSTATSEKSERPALDDRNLAAWSALGGLLLLAALAVPFFAGRVYTADDLGAFHLPLRAFYAGQLEAGEPCDWMPQLFCGFYLTGEGQAGVYHPLHQLLYRFLPLRAATAWEFLLSYPVMMLGTWLWLRRRIGRSDAAMFGGLVFTFSSFNLLHFVHPNAVAIVAHVPWLLWSIDVVLTDARPRCAALAAVFVALLTGSELLLGYPQYVWFSLLTEFCYAVFLTFHVGNVAARWPRLAIAKAIGLLLGGIQLLPTLDAWLASARTTVGPEFAFWGSLHPANLVQLVAPYFFANRVVGDSTHEFGLYVGAVPLMLVAWLWLRRRELGSLGLPALAAAGFGLTAIVLAFGHYGVLDRLAAKLPLVGAFRFPCRYLVLFQLAVAVLATIGFAVLIRVGHEARERSALAEPLSWRVAWSGPWRNFRPLWYVVGLSVVVVMAGVMFCDRAEIGSNPAVLAGPALLGAAALLVAAAARGGTWALAGLVVLAVLDQGWYGVSYAVAKTARFDDFVAAARTPPGKPESRVVASLLRCDEPGLRIGDRMTLAGWSRADGYAGLEPRRSLDYHALPALRAAGVGWVQRGASAAGVAGPQSGDDRWLASPDPLPRARLVTQVQASADPARDIARIPIETTALCEVPLALPASSSGTADIRVDRPGRIEIECECPASQLLVVAESYHAGWRAAVDAQPLTIYRVNGDFLGCVVGPGRQRVVLSFQPSSLERGRLASCIGLSFLSLCLLGFPKRSRPSPSEENVT